MDTIFSHTVKNMKREHSFIFIPIFAGLPKALEEEALNRSWPLPGSLP
jgi:hypothetical protein